MAPSKGGSAPLVSLGAGTQGHPWSWDSTLGMAQTCSRLGIPTAPPEFLPRERLPTAGSHTLALLCLLPTAGPGYAKVGLGHPWECRAPWGGGQLGAPEQLQVQGMCPGSSSGKGGSERCSGSAQGGGTASGTKKVSKKGSAKLLGPRAGPWLRGHRSLPLIHSIKMFISTPRKEQKVSECPVSTACCGRRMAGMAQGWHRAGTGQ